MDKRWARRMEYMCVLSSVKKIISIFLLARIFIPYYRDHKIGISDYQPHNFSLFRFPPVRLFHGTNLLPTEGSPRNLVFEYSLEIPSRKLNLFCRWQIKQLLYVMTGICFWSYLCRVFLGKIISYIYLFIDKFKLYTSCKNLFFSENYANCEIMCNTVLCPDTSQMTVWRMCIAY